MSAHLNIAIGIIGLAACMLLGAANIDVSNTTDEHDFNVMDWPLVGQVSFGEARMTTIDKRQSADSTAYIIVNWRGRERVQIEVQIGRSCWTSEYARNGQIRFLPQDSKDIPCLSFGVAETAYESKTP